MTKRSKYRLELTSIVKSLFALKFSSPRRFYTIVIICFLFGLQASGQLFHENLINSGHRLSYDEIIRQTEKHYDGISREKGNGYKQFQRWKYWAARNLDEHGQVRNALQSLQDFNQYKSKNRSKQQRRLNNNYVELGPQSSEPTSSWSSGIGRVTSIGLDRNDDAHIIVGSPSGGVWKTNDLGANWIPIFDDQALMDVLSLEISHTNPDHYWAGLNGKLVRSMNGGASWTDVSGTSAGMYSTIEMHPSNGNIVFAVNQFLGIVYRSTDGGDIFSKVFDHSSYLYDLEFHPTNPMIVYASGNEAIFKSIDGGINFNQMSGPWSGLTANTMMMAVTPAAPANLYVLEEERGGFNAVYFSSNEGLTWTTLTDNSCACQNMLSASLVSTSGQAPRDMDIVVSPTDPSIIHIGGFETWRSVDLGQNWSKTTTWNKPDQSNFIHADIDILLYDNDRILAGTDGGIYFSTDEATSWTDITPGLGIRQFYRIGASETDPGRVSGGSQDNGTGVLVSNVWYDWVGNDGMETFIDWSNEDIVYGTIQFGRLYKSIDGGQTRGVIGQPEGTGNWVTPLEQDPQDPNTIYTARNDVWKSTDAGNTWTSILTDQYFSADEMKIAPSDNNYIYVSSRKKLYRTTDGGENWLITSLPGNLVNYIAIDPFNPAKLAITISGSTTKVMESTDAGATFTDITGNIPTGISIECVSYEPRGDGGLFVGGNPGIYYTPSTLNPNWEDSSNNLPNVRVTELEIRNEVMYVATYGRGLWKIDLIEDSSQNLITMVNPPTTVQPNELVDVFVNYTNAENSNASLLVRFKSPSGDNLGQSSTVVAPGQGTLTMQVQAPSIDDTGYEYEALLFQTGPVQILAQDKINNITVSAPSINSIALINPPTTLLTNEQIDITIDYENAESLDGTITLRLKSPSGENLAEASTTVAPGQGSVNLQFISPSTEGSGYTYEAVLSGAGISELAKDIVTDVTVNSSTDSYSITLLDAPTSVFANELVDITVNYNNVESNLPMLIVRYLSPSGENLEQALIRVPVGQGTETLQVQAPTNIGSGYSYKALLVQTTPTFEVLAEDYVYDVTVASSIANSITLIDPPTQVAVDELVDITVDYTNTESSDVTLIVTFKGPSGDDLTQSSISVPPGQGTETVQVQAPSTPGDLYSYEAVLSLTGVGELAQDVLTNVTVNPAASSVINLINPPTTITQDEEVTVSVSYNNSESSSAIIIVRYVSPTGQNLADGQSYTAGIPSGPGTLDVQVKAPSNVGSGYSYRAILIVVGQDVLVEDFIYDVTVEPADTNAITILNRPTTVIANELVDITVDYTNIESSDVSLIVRFMNSIGDNLGQASKNVPPGQGTETLQVIAPADAGQDYDCEAILEMTDIGIVAQDIVNDITVVGDDNSTCDSTIIQTDNSIIINSLFAHSSIISNGLIESDSDIEFVSGQLIQLVEDFEVQVGAVFHAYIESCGQ